MWKPGPELLRKCGIGIQSKSKMEFPCRRELHLDRLVPVCVLLKFSVGISRRIQNNGKNLSERSFRIASFSVVFQPSKRQKSRSLRDLFFEESEIFRMKTVCTHVAQQNDGVLFTQKILKYRLSFRSQSVSALKPDQIELDLFRGIQSTAEKSGFRPKCALKVKDAQSALDDRHESVHLIVCGGYFTILRRNSEGNFDLSRFFGDP